MPKKRPPLDPFKYFPSPDDESEPDDQEIRDEFMRQGIVAAALRGEDSAPYIKKAKAQADRVISLRNQQKGNDNG